MRDSHESGGHHAAGAAEPGRVAPPPHWTGSRSAECKSGASEVSLLGNAIAKQAIVLGFVLEQLPEFQPGWRNWQTRQT
jgi:hypothetical protein